MQAEFFLSYTSCDQDWAEWIAWTLEDYGLSVKLQAWNFVPGSNFVLEIHRLAMEADRTIAVLSPEYLASQFGAPEWAAAFAQDPEGFRHRLVPVRVRECCPTGLLRSISYIDLAGMEEFHAKRRLIQGIKGERAKPNRQPIFPGRQQSLAKPKPEFPGPKNQKHKTIKIADQASTLVENLDDQCGMAGVSPPASYQWEIFDSKT
jgi:TIR domain